jgi:hypothetical protein
VLADADLVDVQRHLRFKIKTCAGTRKYVELLGKIDQKYLEFISGEFFEGKTFKVCKKKNCFATV